MEVFCTHQMNYWEDRNIWLANWPPSGCVRSRAGWPGWLRCWWRGWPRQWRGCCGGWWWRQAAWWGPLTCTCPLPWLSDSGWRCRYSLPATVSSEAIKQNGALLNVQIHRNTLIKWDHDVATPVLSCRDKRVVSMQGMIYVRHWRQQYMDPTHYIFFLWTSAHCSVPLC